MGASCLPTLFLPALGPQVDWQAALQPQAQKRLHLRY